MGYDKLFIILLDFSFDFRPTLLLKAVGDVIYSNMANSFHTFESPHQTLAINRSLPNK